MGSHGGICTLCLEEQKNCEAVEGNTKNILCTLLPKIDFTMIRGPVICSNCADMLMKCFDFKTKCLHTHNSTVLFTNKNDKLNVEDVYLSKNQKTCTGGLDLKDICRFCLGLVKNGPTVSPQVKEEDDMLDKMVTQCLPELDLGVIEKPVICATCLGSLENFFHFVTKCSIAEEKIKKYCETIGGKDEIDLTSVLEFTISGVDGNPVDRIKVERQFCKDKDSRDETEIDEGGRIFKLEEMFVDGCKYPIENVKIESDSFTEVADRKVNVEQFTTNNMLALKEEGNKLDFVKSERLFCEENNIEQNLVKMEEQRCLLNEEIKIKTDDDDFDWLSEPEITTSLCEKQKCLTSDLGRDTMTYIEETLTNKNVSTIALHKCNSCVYQTKYKTNFKRHLLKHKDPFQAFTGLKHKEHSEIKMYNCETCSYQTKFKNDLKRHLLKHKESSEVSTYKCDSCLFQTKHKESLKKHLLNHKDPSRVTMYKCALCLYQTNRKDHLKKHSLKHKDPSEVTMYICESCSYQTKFKHYLKRHSVKHKDRSELTLHKCDFCSFQTTRKECLKKHLLRHKDPSEITIYKCDSCSYQAKYKKYLKRHLMLNHKNSHE